MRFCFIWAQEPGRSSVTDLGTARRVNDLGTVRLAREVLLLVWLLASIVAGFPCVSDISETETIGLPSQFARDSTGTRSDLHRYSSTPPAERAHRASTRQVERPQLALAAPTEA